MASILLLPFPGWCAGPGNRIWKRLTLPKYSVQYIHPSPTHPSNQGRPFAFSPRLSIQYSVPYIIKATASQGLHTYATAKRFGGRLLPRGSYLGPLFLFVSFSSPDKKAISCLVLFGYVSP